MTKQQENSAELLSMVAQLALLIDMDKVQIDLCACGAENYAGNDEAQRMCSEIIGDMAQARLDAACVASRKIIDMMAQLASPQARENGLRALAAIQDPTDYFQRARERHRAEHAAHAEGMH